MTFGVRPILPASEFGYIVADKRIGATDANQVKRFVEKPKQQVAAELIEEGALWNSGIFIARSDVILAVIEKQAPDILDACTRAVEGAVADGRFRRLQAQTFAKARAISIDHAVLEKHERIAVLPMRQDWSDLGSWQAVAELFEADADGNRMQGDVKAYGCENTYIDSRHRLTAALGLSDITIIDTPDALLVAHKDELGKVGAIVADLAAAERPEVMDHRRVSRPWGSFESVDRGGRFQVKRIIVKPGGALSLQYHYHRAEHWVVVRGTARVTCAERDFLLFENESTYIPMGTVHRLENPGKEPLELVEVQTGAYLGEDDIVRLDDRYGRSAPSRAR